MKKNLTESRKVSRPRLHYTHLAKEFDANVSRLSATIEPNTEEKLYLSIATGIELPTGGAGRAEIIKGIQENTLIIPRKALLGNSVMVVQNEWFQSVKLQRLVI